MPATQFQLTELMAEYLIAAPGIEFHGAEGMTVEEVVYAGYQDAVAKGWVPSQRELIAAYPELSDEINHFFRGNR